MSYKGLVYVNACYSLQKPVVLANYAWTDKPAEQQAQNIWRVPWKLWDGASPMKPDLILEVVR